MEIEEAIDQHIAEQLEEVTSVKKKSRGEIISMEREVYEVHFNWHTRGRNGEDYHSHRVGSRNVLFMEEHDKGNENHRVDLYYENGEQVTLYNINQVHYKLKEWMK